MTTQNQKIVVLTQAIGADIKTIKKEAGALGGLFTNDKTSLVAAINELKSSWDEAKALLQNVPKGPEGVQYQELLTDLKRDLGSTTDTDDQTHRKLVEVLQAVISTSATSKWFFEGYTRRRISALFNKVESTMDTDQDGLSDATEYSYGSNPYDQDTDKDGWKDGYESSSSINDAGVNPLLEGDFSEALRAFVEAAYPAPQLSSVINTSGTNWEVGVVSLLNPTMLEDRPGILTSVKVSWLATNPKTGAYGGRKEFTKQELTNYHRDQFDPEYEYYGMGSFATINIGNSLYTTEDGAYKYFALTPMATGNMYGDISSPTSATGPVFLIRIHNTSGSSELVRKFPDSEAVKEFIKDI